MKTSQPVTDYRRLVSNASSASSSGAMVPYYNVKDYGAVGNGSTNDSAAIQAAIDACAAAGGGTVYFPAATYACNALALKSGVRLLGEGSASILKKNAGTTDYVVKATGTTGTAVSLNANGVKGTDVVTAATNPASLAAGDYVLIRDTVYKVPTGSWGRNQELNRVLSVSGSGPYTFNLATNLLGGYATASTAEILKLNAVTGATVERLKIDSNAPTRDGGLLGFDLAYDFRVRNCYFVGAWTLPAVCVIRSAHFLVTGCDFRDGYDVESVSGGSAYGVSIQESSHNGTITDNYSENIKEHNFTNNARYHLFSNNIMRNHYTNGVNTHGSGNEHVLFLGNTVDGCRINAGMSVGHSACTASDTDIQFIGNTILNTAVDGLRVVSHDAAIVHRRILISGNSITNWGQEGTNGYSGILIDGHALGYVTDVSVVNNFVLGGYSGATGIYSYGANDVLISSNKVQGQGYWGILLLGTSARTIVSGNEITGWTGENVYVSGTVTSLRVSDNMADDATLVGTSIGVWTDNTWNAKPDRAHGSAAITTGATIAHGLYAAPTAWGVQQIAATPTGVYVTADATNLTVTFGGGGTQTFKWWAEV